MDNCVCTIITRDYVPWAKALHQSLLSNSDGEVVMYVFVATQREECSELTSTTHFRFLFLEDLCLSGLGQRIKEKYYTSYMDGFRWSMKPVLINHLLTPHSKVLYLDCDLFFYSDYSFLFEKLNSSSVLLTPHWRSSNPEADPRNFHLQYNSGLFNGGFVGANRSATPIMEWWARACEFICVKDQSRGHFVDQTHLNLLPVFFDNVEILKHRGCNVASWNRYECQRVRIASGEVLINGVYPIVFVHFTGSTIRNIIMGTDAELTMHLEKFSNTLKEFGWEDIIKKTTLRMAEKRKGGLRKKVKKTIKKILGW